MYSGLREVQAFGEGQKPKGAFDYELWRSHIHATLNSCASGARVMKGSTPESAER